ncbi:MAG TPA: NAD(P)H-dependent oxidoreductase [Phycisphaerales bacterium]|nr:NAD(P)H-dependent oxidoreductase [Phycisphaerales bacterium]
MPTTVAVLIGSLRKGSFNRKVADTLAKLAPSLHFQDVNIGDLPLFNEDLEATPPTQWLELRARIKSADAVLFATPEYNRSVPGVLKNAIDVASRPYGQNVFDGKPGAVISVSIGPSGGFGANHHLRQSLAYLNIPTMAQPEVYIAKAGTLFDEHGNLTDERTKELLTRFVTTFERWIQTNRQVQR